MIKIESKDKKFKTVSRWNTPLNGTYKERVTDYNGGTKLYDIKVQVLGETDKSFLIYLLENTTKYKPYHEMLVRKKSVIIPELDKFRGDKTKYWWKKL